MNRPNDQQDTCMFKTAKSFVSIRHILTLIIYFVFSSFPSTSAANIDENDPIIAFELSQHQQLLNTVQNGQTPLTPFVTDGCSGGLSVGWNYLAEKIPQFASIHGTSPPWEQCCVTHDHAYHKGANPVESKEASFTRRLAADRILMDCVLETKNRRTAELLKAYDITEKELTLLYQATSELMYRAVRLGGIPCSGLPWRWGFGQPECR